GSALRGGDVLIGLAASGIHSNGYSLVRKILDKSGLGPDDTMPGSDRTVKDVLLEPTYIYSDVVRNLMRDLPVKGMVHITGGGFYDNIPRVLPNSVTADIKFASWDVQPVFHWLREEGGLTWPEMLQIFNCGIGYVFIVPSEVAEEAMGRLEAMHKGAWVIGTIGRRQDKDEEQVKILF
uniref:AIR synthase-related protein n=1 Tax=Bilophila wadsworthia TaxID=35833 RepID=UPI002432905A